MQRPTPILFCIFNRPNVTQQVFQAIKRHQPEKLFICADGPRTDLPQEAHLVQQARHIATQVDWDCELRTNFSEVNLGCKHRMASGVSWAFEHTDELIIIEDDCLPDPTFFSFCTALLDRYRNNEQIMMISGDNFQPPSTRSNQTASYYFSRWTHIWGWATWKRAWQHFDVEMGDWPQTASRSAIETWCDSTSEIDHWTNLFNAQHAGEIDTWDFPWMYTCWKRNGLTVLPRHNLVTNLGFSASATHTTDTNSRLANLPVQPIKTPLIHPSAIARDIDADLYTLETIMCPPQPPPKPRPCYLKRLTHKIQKITAFPQR